MGWKMALLKSMGVILVLTHCLGELFPRIFRPVGSRRSRSGSRGWVAGTLHDTISYDGFGTITSETNGAAGGAHSCPRGALPAPAPRCRRNHDSIAALHQGFSAPGLLHLRRSAEPRRNDLDVQVVHQLPGHPPLLAGRVPLLAGPFRLAVLALGRRLHLGVVPDEAGEESDHGQHTHPDQGRQGKGKSVAAGCARDRCDHELARDLE